MRQFLSEWKDRILLSLRVLLRSRQSDQQDLSEPVCELPLKYKANPLMFFLDRSLSREEWLARLGEDSLGNRLPNAPRYTNIKWV